jgi:hypothetical protein
MKIQNKQNERKMKIEEKNQQKYIEERKKWSIVILTGFCEKVQLNLKGLN